VIYNVRFGCMRVMRGMRILKLARDWIGLIWKQSYTDGLFFSLIFSWKKALLSHCIATHDDILTLALELLQNPKNKDILSQLQKQFQYVFVDEFQGIFILLSRRKRHPVATDTHYSRLHRPFNCCRRRRPKYIPVSRKRCLCKLLLDITRVSGL
jgi:hypothetical protein